MVKIEHRTQNT